MNALALKGGIGPALKSFALPVAILVLVAMMVVPVPTFLLDAFFIMNIVISLAVLMVALNAQKPLDFSAFPTVLLFATLFRLGLNVASTRVVLGHGHEGEAAADFDEGGSDERGGGEGQAGAGDIADGGGGRGNLAHAAENEDCGDQHAAGGGEQVTGGGGGDLGGGGCSSGRHGMILCSSCRARGRPVLLQIE